MPDDNPLELITTEDMIDEIKRRHPLGCLVVLISDRDKETEIYRPRWNCGTLTLLGMARYAQMFAERCLTDEWDKMEEDDG